MKLKLGAKINFMFVVIILVSAVILAFVMSKAIRSSIEEFAVDKAKSDLTLSYQYIEGAFPGDWIIKDGQLYKGNLLMNENEELVDQIANVTGDTIAIYQGNTSVATTILREGKRTVGTTVSEEVAQKILTDNEEFEGSVNVLGEEVQAAYMPLKNTEGETIGILYAGAPDDFISTTINKIIKSFAIILLVILVFAISCLALFTRYIRVRLKKIVDVLKEAGKGNFTQTIEDSSSDELGDVARSYNQMASHVKNLMTNIREHSDEVGLKSQQLITNANETSNATENAAQAISKIVGHVNVQQNMVEQSAYAINDVTNSISMISENASSAVEASSVSKEKAVSGQFSVDKVIQQMTIINNSNEQTNEVIKELEVRSVEIGKIIDAITAIADQTNLLALNAAIESARAGEHGKGFAVVADEVRKLAEQSRNSASLISTLVEAIQADTEKVANLMNRTHDEIQNGMDVVKDTGVTFNEIYSSVESANNQIQELSAVTEEMAASMQQINASFDEVSTLAKSTSEDASVISEVTDNQKRLAEKVTQAAKQLEIQSKELDEGIKHFMI